MSLIIWFEGVLRKCGRSRTGRHTLSNAPPLGHLTFVLQQIPWQRWSDIYALKDVVNRWRWYPHPHTGRVSTVWVGERDEVNASTNGEEDTKGRATVRASTLQLVVGSIPVESRRKENPTIYWEWSDIAPNVVGRPRVTWPPPHLPRRRRSRNSEDGVHVSCPGV